MLTGRGFWLLFFALLLLATGVGFDSSPLGVMALALLLWFFWEWFLFAVRFHGLAHHLHVVRQLRDDHGTVESLWAGQTFSVRIQLQLEGGFSLPYIKISDWVPFGIDKVLGPTDVDGSVSPEQPLELSYKIHCPNPGRIRFEGVAVEIADLQGFFYHGTFLSQPKIVRVMPPLVDVKGHFPDVKRHNVLPILGQHRHRRPGSGSELLDLRDYIPGDPPKTIAWKVSARRDRLITKEFESEVPLRCTVFVDTSNSVRVGPPGANALTRLIEISASVAQATTGGRDLTGLCLFNEEQTTTYVRPARGARHLVKLLNLLADAGDQAPATGEAKMIPLLRLGYAVAQELYPGELRSDLNHSPVWLPWFWPPAWYTLRRPSAVDKLDRGLYLTLLTVWIAILGWLLWSVERSFGKAELGFSSIFGRVFLGMIFFGISLTGFFITLTLLRSYIWFLPSRRRYFHRRKRLSALLSARYGLAPGGLATLLEDDKQFTLYLQRFLAEHQVPYPLPMHDRKGRYLFAAPEKINVLSSALLRAVGKGHDNELFVLLVDLLELEDSLGPLLRAIKVARARHHRVLVICPWPPNVAPPTEGHEVDKTDLRRESGDEAFARLRHRLRRTTRERFHTAFHSVQRVFARLGVQLVCAQTGDPVRLILQRLEQMRRLEKSR